MTNIQIFVCLRVAHPDAVTYSGEGGSTGNDDELAGLLKWSQFEYNRAVGYSLMLR